MDQFLHLPFGVAAAGLFAIVMLRVNATYWIGRRAAAGVEHTRFVSSWNGRRASQAKQLVRRWGPVAVTLSFLTVGLQTAVNLAAAAAGLIAWLMVRRRLRSRGSAAEQAVPIGWDEHHKDKREGQC